MNAPVAPPPQRRLRNPAASLRAGRRRGTVAVLGRVLLVGVLLAVVGGTVWATADWSGARRDGNRSALEIPALQVEPAPVVLGTVAQPSAAAPPPALQAAAPTVTTPNPRPATGQQTLTAWADRLAGRIDVPARALYAYALTDLAMRKIDPGCHLSWVTLAGIGRVESNHGRFGGAMLLPNGNESKPIIGVPLDGSGGNASITDTDGGALDGDRVLDRAVGPMQFIPSTWARWRSDGNGDGIADPENIDDAALTAGRYLCAGGRDMATGAGWAAAVLSYNNSVVDGQRAYGAAESYARASTAA